MTRGHNNMQDTRRSVRVQTFAITLWLVTGVLLGAAWVGLWMRPEDFRLSAMLALTASVTAIPAGVAQLRVYNLRLQSLIRMTAGLVYDQRVDAAVHDAQERVRLRSVQ